MNYLTPETKHILHETGYMTPQEGDYLDIFSALYTRIYKGGEKNVDYARYVLKTLRDSFGVDLRYAVRIPQKDIEYHPLTDQKIEEIVKDNKNLCWQIHEIGLCALICITFKVMNLNYIVGITQQSDDGQFDISVSKVCGNKYSCEFLFDMKSGKNYSDTFFKDWDDIAGDDKNLFRIIKDVDDNFGCNVNRKKERKGVFVLSLERFIKNLACIITAGYDIDQVVEILEKVRLESRKILSKKNYASQK